MRRVLWLVSLATWLGLYGVGFAQDEPEEEAPAAEAEASEPGPAAAEEGAASPEQKDEPAAASGKTPQWWVGAYLDGIIVPSFMLNLFLAETLTVFNASFGATITHRNADGFSWVLGIGYAGYAFDGPFRADGDPVEDTEYLNSSLGLLNVRGMLLWSTDITPQLSFEYGVGIQFGVVLGSLIRSEAYKDANGDWHACEAPLTPDPFFCEQTENMMHSDPYDAEGAQYGVKEERVPPIAGTIMLPALALRYTPIPQLAIKLEASYDILQFSFGLSVAYGIDG